MHSKDKFFEIMTLKYQNTVNYPLLDGAKQIMYPLSNGATVAVTGYQV